MNLYKIWQDKNNDWDTYDSAIVCAENEEEAKRIHPSEYIGKSWNGESRDFDSWCNIRYVQVVYIGEAADSVKKGIVLSSFNAG